MNLENYERMAFYHFVPGRNQGNYDDPSSVSSVYGSWLKNILYPF